MLSLSLRQYACMWGDNCIPPPQAPSSPLLLLKIIYAMGGRRAGGAFLFFWHLSFIFGMVAGVCLVLALARVCVCLYIFFFYPFQAFAVARLSLLFALLPLSPRLHGLGACCLCVCTRNFLTLFYVFMFILSLRSLRSHTFKIDTTCERYDVCAVCCIYIFKTFFVSSSAGVWSTESWATVGLYLYDLVYEYASSDEFRVYAMLTSVCVDWITSLSFCSNDEWM